MGSNDCGPMKISGNDADECSATTVEIKIKTLDSETFTLRVDKCVPVPELKEQIASVTGVLSERQRLICRGKVLKDDQLLSAYHVEDGHTLHLVVRQPVTPSPEASSDQPASDPASSTENYPGNRASPSMMVGTFNISEQGDGSFPDLNRILSAVINSFGMGRPGSSSEGTDLNQTPSERLSTAFTLGVGGQAASTAVPVESAQPPIIPDSLTTLLQYLGHLREEMIVNVRREIPSFLASEGQDFVPAAVPSTESRRLLTPEFLAEVMSSIRQLLIEQATTSLSQLAGELYRQARVTCPLERSRIQAYALRSGNLFQNLGSLMLELGRAVMTLRMGQSPADALVNAGPAVYLTSTGPNPIMVQPLPYQAGASSGSVPVGTVQNGSSLAGGSGGSGFVPRNIDIRIRAGSLFARREPTGSQAQEQVAPLQSNIANSGQQQDGSGLDSGSNNQARAIPLRAFAPGRSGSSDSPRGSIGVLYPVMARVQHITLASSRASQTSEHQNPDPNNEQPIPDFATQPQNTGGIGNTSLPSEDQDLSGQSRSEIEQILRRLFPGGTFVRGNEDPTPPIQTEPVNRGVRNSQVTAQDVGSSQAAASDEGIFLSSILRQIMPMISENAGAETNVPSTEGANNSGEAQADENPDQVNSSRRRHSSQSQENSKRHRRN